MARSSLLDDTQEPCALQASWKASGGACCSSSGCFILGFAVILILAAIWLGLWFAERLSRPVGRLASAAQRVGEGDLDVRVHEEAAATTRSPCWGTLFNQMTRQLKGQRERSLEPIRADRGAPPVRFGADLGDGGVIGLDAEGRVDLRQPRRRTAAGLVARTAIAGAHARRAGIRRAFRAAERQQRRLRAGRNQGQPRRGKQESLLVRMSTRRNKDGKLEGYVVAFDDVTDLVSGAAHGGLGRRGPPHRARDQEPADAHPAVGRAHQAQVRQLSERGGGRSLER
jgi:two-component system nitrogen regulation sensor histidine kinase NtrY